MAIEPQVIIKNNFKNLNVKIYVNLQYFLWKKFENKQKHNIEFNILYFASAPCTAAVKMCETWHSLYVPATQRTAMKSGHIVVDDRTPRWKGSLHARLKRGGN